ncbi:MAG TPA: flagellar basal body L-ring protein FlgH [Woeseiaceae bacterium]|nr:flagellar basal body L-ring protein FlgH [Woeseiaceae bacterium]
MTRTSMRTFLCGAVAAIACAGCGGMPERVESWPAPVPVETAAATPTDGAIYRDSGDVRLFEDVRAARVGDVLTVRLIERTNATKNAATSTSKSSEAAFANPVVFGRPVTRNGVPIGEGSLSGEVAFDGSGSSTQSNSLTGDIAVTVVARYPNGNLRIQGDKWVTLNQGREFIRLSGIVRPFDIGPDNSIPSSKVADAQITYSSEGVLAEANRMGFLTRFFNSGLWPF